MEAGRVGQPLCLRDWESHKQGSGLGDFLAPGSSVIRHQLSLFQDREKVLTVEVIDASEDSASELTASGAQGGRPACDSRGVIKWEFVHLLNFY